MAPAARRAQTSKQAKAAYKARGGSSYVSEAERKQLARGAELLRRAERLKLQEERRKEWMRKKEADEERVKRGKAPLGEENVLDKFGYQSSQFHLGKFFQLGGAKARVVEEVQKEEEDISSAGLSVDTASPSLDYDTDTASETDLSVFLDSSTQLARDLDETAVIALPTTTTVHVATRANPSLSFSSFGSGDDLFDATTVSELDKVAAVAAPTCGPSAEKHSTASNDRAAMPPPARPVMRDERPVPQMNLNELRRYGIRNADLEWVADCDVQLSQW